MQSFLDRSFKLKLREVLDSLFVFKVSILEMHISLIPYYPVKALVYEVEKLSLIHSHFVCFWHKYVNIPFDYNEELIALLSIGNDLFFISVFFVSSIDKNKRNT